MEGPCTMRLELLQVDVGHNAILVHPLRYVIASRFSERSNHLFNEEIAHLHQHASAGVVGLRLLAMTKILDKDRFHLIAPVAFDG